MNNDYRKGKIPLSQQYLSVIVTTVLLVLAIFFDFMGLQTIVKWLLIVLGIGGVILGGYFLYLRSKE